MIRLSSLIISTIICLIVLSNFDHNNEFNPEDFALGDENTSQLGIYNGFPINSTGLDNANLIIEGYRNSDIDGNVILYLGNSQLHGINDYQIGDQNSAEILLNINFQ